MCDFFFFLLLLHFNSYIDPHLSLILVPSLSFFLSLLFFFFLYFDHTWVCLYRFRDGDTIDVLADALDDLRTTLQGVRAISFTGDSRDVIEYAANLLGPSMLHR